MQLEKSSKRVERLFDIQAAKGMRSIQRLPSINNSAAKN
jgi:hypothetical protein